MLAAADISPSEVVKGRGGRRSVTNRGQFTTESLPPKAELLYRLRWSHARIDQFERRDEFVGIER